MMVSIPSRGQGLLNEKRIYMLDVTASMVGEGVVETPNIFSEVKSKLAQAISDIQSLQTEVVVIPFTDSPFEPIRGFLHDKDSLLAAITNIDIRRGDTNIAGAWDRGLRELDSTKVNYMFLLTDGLHNCVVEKDTLYKKLSSWSDLSKGKHMFAFYVMLTPHARELEIAQIVDNTNQMWLIESMDVNASFINSSVSVSVNVNEDSKVKLWFTSNNNKVFNKEIDFHISLEKNPYYAIRNFDIHFYNRYVEFELEELRPRIEIPLETNLLVFIEYDKTKYPLIFFTPETINFNVINKGVRTMKIREK